MKVKSFLFVLFVFFSINAESAFAGWAITIHAEGQDMGGQYKNEVIIGVGARPDKASSPPPAPNFTCSMAVMTGYEWDKSLVKDIRKEGEATYHWVIAINPHGNMGPQTDATATMKWDPFGFGEGRFELREGWDGQRDVLISDMKTDTTLDVTGGNETGYFTVICEHNG